MRRALAALAGALMLSAVTATGAIAAPANPPASRSQGAPVLRDAKAGEAWYASQGFATSHEYPAGVGHALDGKFGRVVGQCIDSRAPRINR